MHPAIKPGAPCTLYCNVVLADDNAGTLYSDFTRKFPIRLFGGNKYILVVYVYDIDLILIKPMKSQNKEELYNNQRNVQVSKIQKNHT